MILLLPHLVFPTNTNLAAGIEIESSLERHRCFSGLLHGEKTGAFPQVAFN